MFDCKGLFSRRVRGGATVRASALIETAGNGEQPRISRACSASGRPKIYDPVEMAL
ncbi:MAG TPA: hypothetical protein PLC40_07110 [Candidatus Hydrogenedentes bacterium]|nr:hypothetical protein [Candidatus Hydrogenedentota bacterium]